MTKSPDSKTEISPLTGKRVTISEYEISDKRFKQIYQVEKRSLKASKKQNIIMQEKIYWNGVSL